ncbi:universal stress protein [Rhizobium lusitanum]|uniref:Nucleotide-binding universal stress protein, UspA family n=1 Tax=Rhizobium lusitanum TaxID=293958 RepID=A0A1C3XGI4_9HYPH|nr:universal stress protein [Rhizobium lusitanum]SCB51265.1 Nucleotide-binding universal stress protein, UspA family [Rhizobium lusitanum]
MSIKTVLCILDVNQFKNDLKGAVDFCQTHGAHLTALIVSMGGTPPHSAYDALSITKLNERQREIDSLTEKAADIRSQLSGNIASFDVQEVYTEFPWADEDIADRALYADLVLIGPQAARNEELQQRVIDGALFQSPTPVLVNASGKTLQFASKVILLAWDSSEEAARAARQSIDLLQAAGKVHVTIVDPLAPQSVNGKEPGADIAVFLARHGVNVGVDCIASGGRLVDETLRQHAVDIGADIIVMGAYSHLRLRERLFGGVTRSMLEDSDIPLFLAH